LARSRAPSSTSALAGLVVDDSSSGHTYPQESTSLVPVYAMLDSRCCVCVASSTGHPPPTKSLGMATKRDITQTLKPHVSSTMHCIASGRLFPLVSRLSADHFGPPPSWRKHGVMTCGSSPSPRSYANAMQHKHRRYYGRGEEEKKAQDEKQVHAALSSHRDL
jgi:hypothetical protein